jgi:hypothetical protein
MSTGIRAGAEMPVSTEKEAEPEGPANRIREAVRNVRTGNDPTTVGAGGVHFASVLFVSFRT